LRSQVPLFLGVRAITLLPIVGIAFGLGALFEFPRLVFPLQGLAGVTMIVATKILDFKCLRAFSAARGTFYYAHPPERMVTTGPYSYVRNPLYLTLFIDTFGLFLTFGSTAFLMILALEVVGVNYLVVRWEEPGLEQRFGSVYLDYKGSVPRWIPKITGDNKAAED